MPTSLSHDCDYEQVDAPGRSVVPIIVSGDLVRHEAMHRYLERVNTMHPGELYRCQRCGVYVYVTRQHRPLRLRADTEPGGYSQAC